jgi:hypothetical protein
LGAYRIPPETGLLIPSVFNRCTILAVKEAGLGALYNQRNP